MTIPHKAGCVIAGGGPAGMMAGYLLARAGIEVAVLERHADFLRDFRGDTIHPSTLDVMWELGILERFLSRPHQVVKEITADFGARRFRVADFTRLPTHCKFLAFMPQWDFLDFLVQEAKRLASFHLEMEAEADGLLFDGRQICGLGYRTPQGRKQVRADLVIAADGRHSRLRSEAQLPVTDFGSAIDALWLRLPIHPGDPSQPVGRFGAGQIFVMLNRGEYWQCALVIPKETYADIQSRGIEELQSRLREIAGFAADRVETIKSFDDVSLLTVRVDRLKEWARPGFLCIGDAAHAMSPIGGVGINLAIQDAVAAANLLVPVLSRGKTPTLRELQCVQRRREWPAKMTQGFQLFVQNRVLAPGLNRRVQPKPPWLVKVLNRSRWLRQFPARFIGMGVRPEHVTTRAKH